MNSDCFIIALTECETLLRARFIIQTQMSNRCSRLSPRWPKFELHSHWNAINDEQNKCIYTWEDTTSHLSSNCIWVKRNPSVKVIHVAPHPTDTASSPADKVGLLNMDRSLVIFTTSSDFEWETLSVSNSAIRRPRWLLSTSTVDRLSL